MLFFAASLLIKFFFHIDMFSCRCWDRTPLRTPRPGSALPAAETTTAGCCQCKTMRWDDKWNPKYTWNFSDLMNNPVQGGGWTDFDFSRSTLCLVLLGLTGNWQNWLSRWARRRNIIDQSQPNPPIQLDAPPCTCTGLPAYSDTGSSDTLVTVTVLATAIQFFNIKKCHCQQSPS